MKVLLIWYLMAYVPNVQTLEFTSFEACERARAALVRSHYLTLPEQKPVLGPQNQLRAVCLELN